HDVEVRLDLLGGGGRVGRAVLHLERGRRGRGLGGARGRVAGRRHVAGRVERHRRVGVRGAGGQAGHGERERGGGGADHRRALTHAVADHADGVGGRVPGQRDAVAGGA